MQPFRVTMAQLLGVTLSDYSSAQVSYDLRRLRLNHLIQRIPHSHAYQLTDRRCRIAAFFTKLYERLYRPDLVSILPDLPFPIELT